MLITPALVVLLRGCPDSSGPDRSGCPDRGSTVRAALLFLAAGGTVDVAGLLAVAWYAAAARPGPRVLADLSAAFAVTGTLALGLLLAGLLHLPGMVPSDAARLRHALDGLTVAVSGFLVVWLAVHISAGLTAADTGRSGPDVHTLVVAATGLSIVATVGIVAVTVLRATTARRPVLGAAVAVVATAGGVHGVAAGVQYGRGTIVLVWAVAGTSALAALLAIVSRAPALRVRAPEPADTPIAFAVAPALVALGGTLVYAIVVAPPDRLSVFGAVLLGFALAGRQAVAHRDVRAQAVHLAAQGERFRALALTDPLTSLANRRKLQDTLHDHARDGAPCVLIAIDLDGFKAVNDLRGHDIGDIVLSQVASRLRAAIRPGDLAARLGGDEFAVVVRAPLAQARPIADRLLATLSAGYRVPTGMVYLSASIGLAGSTVPADVPALLHNADVALRAAKQRGKNRIEGYTLADERWLLRRTAVEHELRGAVERGELYLAYQPIVRLPGGPPVGVEALLRWRNARLGAVATEEFIRVAEEAALIDRLDAWAMHRAWHQLAAWVREGHDVWMSVNVSVRNLRRPEFVPQVADLLNSHPVLVDRVVFEVAAQPAPPDRYETAARLADLRRLGIRIALDDFGSAHSSLRQITDLPLDMIKVNPGQLLGPGARSDWRAARVVDAVVNLGHGLGLEVIAHGVSGPAHAVAARAAGFRLAQGALYGRPMPAEQVEAMLAAAGPLTRPGAQHVGHVDSGHEMRKS